MRKDLTLALLLALPTGLFAYTDPGTGVFLYQAMAASLVGVVWTARRFISRILARGAGKPTIAED